MESQVAVNEDGVRIIPEGANKQRLGDKVHDSSCDRMIRELRYIQKSNRAKTGKQARGAAISAPPHLSIEYIRSVEGKARDERQITKFKLLESSR